MQRTAENGGGGGAGSVSFRPMGTLARRRTWRALAGAMGIIALFGAMATARHHAEMLQNSPGGEYLTWRHALLQEAPAYLFWALAIPIVYLFVAWLARRGWSWPVMLLAHAGFATLVLLVSTTPHAIVFGMMPLGMILDSMLTAQLFAYLAILGGALALYYSQASVDREVRARELETELAEARLLALRSQLKPHFMFNALNSVAMLVRGGRGPEAVDTIARVSELLRDGLNDDDRAEVPLEEEVVLARRYLAVEEVRFADRLDVRVELTDAARAVPVPRLILQPLVENAVRHGIGARAAAGRIDISARTTEGELIVMVRDDGPGPRLTPWPPLPAGEGEPHVSNGVGLRNTRERLATTYGDAARITLEHAPGGGAIATLVIPL